MDYSIKTISQLGQILRAIRKEKNLTQKEVAEKVGLYPKTISLLESGSPGSTIETVFKSLAALDYDIQLKPRSRKDTESTAW